MTHKTTLVTMVLLAMLYLWSGCNTQNSTPAPSATPKTEDHSQHSMHMMQAMDAMMQRTQAMKMTGDFDVDFANMMIEHHQGAIEMSEIELKGGADPLMKDMAQKIITAQKTEIAKLQAFVQAHPVVAAQQQPMVGGMQAMHDQMKSMPMMGMVDQDFAGMMMIHHQSAVTMAQEELAKGKHAELKQMAQQMIVDQQREIAEFQSWLDKYKK